MTARVQPYLFFVALCAANFTASGQTKSDAVICPTAQGVYAQLAGEWTELPIEPSSRITRANVSFAHDGKAAYYPGAKSSVNLGDSVKICVSGSVLGTTLSIARAQEKKNERRVVVGIMTTLTTFTFGIEKKDNVPFELTRDINRNYIIQTSGLEKGQYFLYLLQGGSASVPPAFSFGVVAR